MRKEITEEQITNLMQAIPRAEEVDRLREQVDLLRAENKRLRADRRDRIATAALQGLLANSYKNSPSWEIVAAATVYADAMIASLDKEPQP